MKENVMVLRFPSIQTDDSGDSNQFKTCSFFGSVVQNIEKNRKSTDKQ